MRDFCVEPLLPTYLGNSELGLLKSLREDRSMPCMYELTHHLSTILPFLQLYLIWNLSFGQCFGRKLLIMPLWVIKSFFTIYKQSSSYFTYGIILIILPGQSLLRIFYLTGSACNCILVIMWKINHMRFCFFILYQLNAIIHIMTYGLNLAG